MDSNVEIAAPAGRRHRLLRHTRCSPAWAPTGRRRRPSGSTPSTTKKNANIAKMATKLGKNSDADGLPLRARRAAHDHRAAARRHAGQRGRQHARPRPRHHRHVPAAQAPRRRHLGRDGHRHGLRDRGRGRDRQAGAGGRGRHAFGFSGMEVETICRYNLPVCIVVFNNNGIYRGTDVDPTGRDPGTDRVRCRTRATTR